MDRGAAKTRQLWFPAIDHHGIQAVASSRGRRSPANLAAPQKDRQSKRRKSDEIPSFDIGQAVLQSAPEDAETLRQPMGNPETDAVALPRPSPSRPNVPWPSRSPADVVSVLLELARALRGFATRDGALTRRRTLSERAFQAVSAEVLRSDRSSSRFAKAHSCFPISPTASRCTVVSRSSMSCSPVTPSSDCESTRVSRSTRSTGCSSWSCDPRNQTPTSTHCSPRSRRGMRAASA